MGKSDEKWRAQNAEAALRPQHPWRRKNDVEVEVIGAKRRKTVDQASHSNNQDRWGDPIGGVGGGRSSSSGNIARRGSIQHEERHSCGIYVTQGIEKAGYPRPSNEDRDDLGPHVRGNSGIVRVSHARSNREFSSTRRIGDDVHAVAGNIYADDDYSPDVQDFEDPYEASNAEARQTETKKSDPLVMLRQIGFPESLTEWKMVQDTVFRNHMPLPEGWIRIWSKSNRCEYFMRVKDQYSTFELSEVLDDE